LHDRGKLDAAYQQQRRATISPFRRNRPGSASPIRSCTRRGPAIRPETDLPSDVAHMVDANRSPIRILERMTGTVLG